MSDTEQAHSNLRADDDALPGDAQPTLDDPGDNKPPADPADATRDRFAAITPGDVITAADVDQSGQVGPEGARQVEGPEG